MIERAGIEAKLGFKAHPHMLRHACGYKLANDGHDTRALQAYLGHKNIQHTYRNNADAVQGLLAQVIAAVSPIADYELTPEEGLRLINEIFGSEDASRPPTRTCRKYFLEYQDGEPVLRLAEMPSKPTALRHEFDVIFDEVMAELFGPDPDGDEIVPQKLAKLFPGSSRRYAAS
jgi:Phage integrase family